MTCEIDPLETQRANLDDVFRRHAFERLRGEGKSVPISELVDTSPNGAASAQRTLDMLVERGMAIVEGENLVAIDGLNVQPTPHRMSLGDDDLFTWCAADAIGIPAALEEDAHVTTSCPHCSREISLSVRQGIPSAGGDLVLWLPTSSCTHVVTQFCPDVNFFCNGEHLETWRADVGEPQGHTLGAEEAVELGRQWWPYLRPHAQSAEGRC